MPWLDPGRGRGPRPSKRLTFSMFPVPTWSGLIDNGTLPARIVGNQRRLPLADGILTYKANTKAKRRAALAELSTLDQELGLR